MYILTPRVKNTPAKSFNIVNKMLAEIMQIPKEKQIQAYSVEELSKYPENAVFIISDDIIASGESMSLAAKYINYAHTLGNRKVLFCPITAAKKGIDYLECCIKLSGRADRDAVICHKDNIMSYEYTAESFVDGEDKRLYSRIFGDAGCANMGMCTVFPYMAPDNNSDLAAYFIKFFTPTNYCIKNRSENFAEISENALFFDVYGKDKNHAERNDFKSKLVYKIRKTLKSILPFDLG